jgi:hypothetical protein
LADLQIAAGRFVDRGRKVLIDVPSDGAPGQEMFFVAPPPVSNQQAPSPSSLSAAIQATPQMPSTRGVQRVGDELFRETREAPQITLSKQTCALLYKNVSIQRRQRKSNCCQACILFTLLVFGVLVPIGPASSAFTETAPLRPLGWEMANWTMNSQHHHNFTAELVAQRKRLNISASQDDNTIAETFLPAQVAVIMFCQASVSMFHLPKYVHMLVEEKQLRLYHAMRLQGMSMTAYWMASYVYGFVITMFSSIIFLVGAWIYGNEAITHDEGGASMGLFAGVTVVWAHAQMGLAFLSSALLRSPKLATILFYLVNVASIFTVFIISSADPEWDWSEWLLLMPTIAYPRGLILVLADGGSWVRPGSELAQALWVPTVSGTVMGMLGILLHVLLPNEFGMSESHLMTQLCAKASPNIQVSNGLDQSLLGARDDPSDVSVDPSVASEEERVRAGDIDDAAPVVVKDLRLSYQSLLQKLKGDARRRICGTMPRPPKQAVKGVSIALETGECFGLLGCAPRFRNPMHGCARA